MTGGVGDQAMSKPVALTIVAALALAGAAAGYLTMLASPPADNANAVATAARPVFTEATWPFPIDQWGTGRAFNCKPADCGTEVTLYLRAKLGFCNCTTGVADDEELERVGDLDLAGSQSAALGPGRPITVHWMKGRSRSYAVGGRVASAKSALSLAFNDRCDAIVATAVVAGDRPSAQEPAVLEFLNGDLVLRWAESTLGI
jgi:hypothetical protein